MRTYRDKVYTSFRDLIVPEDVIEFESFTIISVDSLLVYDRKCYLQVYVFLKIICNECCITIELM